MPRYLEVTTAAQETTTKMLSQRGHTGYAVKITTAGGRTASVMWDHAARAVTLNLPSLPSDTMLSRVEADRITGFVAHEVCHVLHTSRERVGRSRCVWCGRATLDELSGGPADRGGRNRGRPLRRTSLHAGQHPGRGSRARRQGPRRRWTARTRHDARGRKLLRRCAGPREGRLPLPKRGGAGREAWPPRPAPWSAKP
jgi:hypothetical protein